MFQLWFCHYFRDKSFVFLEVESKCLVPTEWPLYVPIVQTRYTRACNQGFESRSRQVKCK